MPWGMGGDSKTVGVSDGATATAAGETSSRLGQARPDPGPQPEKQTRRGPERTWEAPADARTERHKTSKPQSSFSSGEGNSTEDKKWNPSGPLRRNYLPAAETSVHHRWDGARFHPRIQSQTTLRGGHSGMSLPRCAPRYSREAEGGTPEASAASSAAKTKPPEAEQTLHDSSSVSASLLDSDGRDTRSSSSV